MQQGFRAILPAESKSHENGPSPASERLDMDGSNTLTSKGKTGIEKRRPTKKRRSTAILVACNNCRTKKTRCDGRRPVCSPCSGRSLPCTYISSDVGETPRQALERRLDVLQRHLADHDQLIERLRSAPEQEAFEILQRLRTSTNVSFALSSIAGRASTRTRPSELRTYRSVLPTTYSDIEFELSSSHSSVYPVLEQVDGSSFDLEGLFSPRSRGLLGPPSFPDRVAFLSTADDMGSPSPLRGTNTDQNGPHTTSTHFRDYCDPRLNDLKVEYWTKVPIDDEFAACALSHFLTVHLPLLNHFDVDPFIGDLVDQKLGHCSSFLFSSLMSIACQSYSTYDVRSAALSVAFTREAERLWQAERAVDSALNIKAMSLLSMAATMTGEQHIMLTALADARAMATKMNLMDVRLTNELAQGFFELPPDEIRSLATAAWGVYTQISFFSMHFPLDPIVFPPILPIPGDVNRTAHGLVWPLHPLPPWMGQTSKTLAKFWTIVQEIYALYSLKEPETLADRVPLAFAESKYQKLLAWADTLGPEMFRGETNTSHVLFFHGVYHCAVINLLRPFVESGEKLRLRSFSSQDSSPSAIFAASIRQLKRLLVLHYACPPRHTDSGWFNVIVIQVCNTVLRNSANDPDWRIYFQLCIHFWKEAYVRYRVFTVFGQAHLSYALESGAIRSDEALALLEELRFVGRHHEAPEEAITTAILDFERALKDPQHANVEALANQFDDLVVMDQYTTLFDSESSAASQTSGVQGSSSASDRD